MASWSQAEEAALQQLLEKRAVATMAAAPSDDFTLVDGAMSDASKRRESDLSEGPVVKRQGVDRVACTLDGKTKKTTGYVSQAGTPTPMPSMDYRSNPFIPEEVPDLETWGRTVIDFGKFKAACISYEEFYLRQDEQAVSYVKYCTDRVNSGSAQLIDFARYLVYRASKDPSQRPVLPAGPTIAGTSVVRRLK